MDDSRQGGQKADSDSKGRIGGKGAKTYLLCGFVSTGILSEFLFTIVGGIFGVLLMFPLSAALRFLFEPCLGTGGVDLLNEYAMFTGIMLGFLLALLVIRPWRPYLKAFWTGPSGNRAGMLVAGLAIGFAMNAVCVLGAVLAGNINIEFSQFSVVGLLAFLLFIFIQASTEELVCRGFVYQRLNRTYGTAVAVVGSAIIFSLGHALNSGVTLLALVDIFLIGVLYALMVRYFDSIWMAMGAHTAWNFTQNIFFGLPNSGAESSYSFFVLSGAQSNGFAYDAAFGVEGTLLAVVLNVVCIVALFLWGRSHGKKKAYDIWREPEKETRQADGVVADSPAAVAAADAPAAPAAAPKKGWFY